MGFLLLLFLGIFCFPDPYDKGLYKGCMCISLDTKPNMALVKRPTTSSNFGPCCKKHQESEAYAFTDRPWSHDNDLWVMNNRIEEMKKDEAAMFTVLKDKETKLMELKIENTKQQNTLCLLMMTKNKFQEVDGCLTEHQLDAVCAEVWHGLEEQGICVPGVMEDMADAVRKSTSWFEMKGIANMASGSSVSNYWHFIEEAIDNLDRFYHEAHNRDVLSKLIRQKFHNFIGTACGIRYIHTILPYNIEEVVTEFESDVCKFLQTLPVTTGREGPGGKNSGGTSRTYHKSLFAVLINPCTILVCVAEKAAAPVTLAWLEKEKGYDYKEMVKMTEETMKEDIREQGLPVNIIGVNDIKNDLKENLSGFMDAKHNPIFWSITGDVEVDSMKFVF